MLGFCLTSILVGFVLGSVVSVDTSQYTLISSGTLISVTPWGSAGGSVSANFALADVSIASGDSLWIEFNKVSAFTVSSIWTDVGLSWAGTAITQTSTLVQVPADSIYSSVASLINSGKALKIYFNLEGTQAASTSSVSNFKLYKKAASPSTPAPSLPSTSTPTLSPNATPTSFASIYVDCGGTSSYKDSQGVTWIPDTSYAIGGILSTSTQISNVLAKSQRYWTRNTINSTSGEYIYTGVNGVFTVTVYLAEPYFTSAGKRAFNVQINGQKLFTSDVDLYALYGFGTLKSFSVDVTVSVKAIRITVNSTINNPTLAGFSVVQKVTAAPTAVPSTATPTASPTTRAPTRTPTVTPTRSPTVAPTSGPTTIAPTVSPSALCTSVVDYDDFSSGSYTKLFSLSNCGSGISVGTSSANSSKKSLTVKLLQGCGAAKLISKKSYGGGYFETVARLGGQGAAFTGLVYSWYTRECDNGYCQQPNEIDFEWLGRASKAGQTQSNWFYNGVGAGLHEKFHSAPAAPYNQFVKWAFRWTDSAITWYINDVQVRQELYNTTKVTTARKQQLFISLWDGSSYSDWAGVMNWSSTAKDLYLMEFQYVKICAT